MVGVVGSIYTPLTSPFLLKNGDVFTGRSGHPPFFTGRSGLESTGRSGIYKIGPKLIECILVIIDHIWVIFGADSEFDIHLMFRDVYLIFFLHFTSLDI